MASVAMAMGQTGSGVASRGTIDSAARTRRQHDGGDGGEEKEEEEEEQEV